MSVAGSLILVSVELFVCKNILGKPLDKLRDKMQGAAVPFDTFAEEKGERRLSLIDMMSFLKLTPVTQDSDLCKSDTIRLNQYIIKGCS